MNTYFIIPVYKTEKFLKRCVDSVLNQRGGNVYAVLVDDGSPDNCPAICDEYAKKYPNVSVIHKANGGLSDARNAGIEYVLKVASAEDFITFLDSDDFVHKNYLSVMLTLCEKYGCDAVQCGYEKGSADEFSASTVKIRAQIMSGEEALLDQRLKSQVWAKLYKVSAFNDIRFPKGVLNEDEYTTYKAVYKAKKMALTDAAYYYYYQHGDSIMVDIAKRMKNNPHLFDWLDAYRERLEFFGRKNKPEQIMRTHEKICTDVILRYCEQMYLKKDERDEALTSGEYIRIYKLSYPIMMERDGISLKRRLMYIMFRIMPYSAVLTSKIFGLRK